VIVVKISGGLGNTLFQYAYGLALAKRNNTELWCDLSGYKSGNDVRQLELRNIFGGKVKHSQAVNCLKYLRHVKEKTFMFDPKLKSLSDFRYVSGYFQSYKYFNVNDMRFTDSIHFDYVRERVAASGADAAIHLRRGDYLKSISHYVLPANYYINALNALNANKIIIFSDDPEYAKGFRDAQCLKGQRTFEVWENIDAVHDLAAMSYFKNIVMANSSFSCWAAYLSSARVICPNRHFTSEQNMDDFYKPEWIRV
jgi:hypothetical protein